MWYIPCIIRSMADFIRNVWKKAFFSGFCPAETHLTLALPAKAVFAIIEMEEMKHEARIIRNAGYPDGSRPVRWL